MIEAFERWLLRNFDQREQARAAELTGPALRSFLGVLTLAGTIAFIAVAFQDIAPEPALTVWLTAMSLAAASPALLVITFAIHGPSRESALRPYSIVGRVTSFCLAMLVAGGVWLLLPHAPLPLQFVVLMLLVTFVAMVLGADPSPVLMVEQLVIMASAIAFVLVYRLPYAAPLAVVLGVVTASLVGMNRMTYNSTRAAVVARAEAERANAALAVALAEVARERDAKTHFIAAASHDLRQPVQAAALYFEHALSGAGPEQRTRAITGAKRAFASVDAILGTMLDHLRFESGMAEARLEALELSALLAGVVEQQAAVAGEAGISLRFVPTRLWVQADAAMLPRVLGNLLANATKHSKGRRVLLGARRSGGDLLIWVIDDGRGIDPADAPHVFDGFFKGGGANAAADGFGIGLSSCRSMMELMGGEIALSPRWRNGSAFSLRLPLAAPVREALRWKAA